MHFFRNEIPFGVGSNDLKVKGQISSPTDGMKTSTIGSSEQNLIHNTLESNPSTHVTL